MKQLITYTDIDGLRTIAVLSHFLPLSICSGKTLSKLDFLVLIYFVISGYLITSILLADLKPKLTLLNFYERRAKNPTYLALCNNPINSTHGSYYYRQSSNNIPKHFQVYFCIQLLFLEGRPILGGGIHIKPFLHTWSLRSKSNFISSAIALTIHHKSKQRQIRYVFCSCHRIFDCIPLHEH